MSFRAAWIPTLIVVATLTAAGAAPDPLDQELAALTEKLSKQLVSKGRKKVAALDFTDLQGRRNELGRYLAEQLTVELVIADGIAVVDRANLKSILDEHKLTEEGLVNPENAKKLGQFSGLDAIIIGNLSATDRDIVLLVKAISTETAEVVAAGRAKFPKTSEFQQLLSSGIISGGAATSVPGGGDTSAGSVDTKAIATKDIGRLRVTLKNVAPVKTRSRKNQDGDAITGIVCSFEFANLDLQKTLKVACNGRAKSTHPLRFLLRGKLTDSNGHEWRLSETVGLAAVACGVNGDPGMIGRLIQLGKYTTSQDLYNSNGDNSAMWGGDFTPFEPGKTGRVSMTFYDLDKYGNQTDYVQKSDVDFFQLEGELVIGTGEPGTKDAQYRLEALVLDKILMPETADAVSQP